MEHVEPRGRLAKKKKKSGIPTGNAGEYLVMGELLRRGFDAQLADRNTKGYDLLAGLPGGDLRRVQVKTVRTVPWFVNQASFEEPLIDQVTVYVLLGQESNPPPVRFFIVRNRDVADHAHVPDGWTTNGFLKLKAIEQFENRWDILKAVL
jgi:hypothetical protein